MNPGGMRVWGKRWVRTRPLKILWSFCSGLRSPSPESKGPDRLFALGPQDLSTCYSCRHRDLLPSQEESQVQLRAYSSVFRPRSLSPPPPCIRLLPSSLRHSPEVPEIPSPRLPLVPGPQSTPHWLLPRGLCHPRASAKPRRLCPKVVAAIVCRLKRGCLAPSSQAQCLGWETHAKTSLQQLPGDIQLPCITLNVPRASCNAPDLKADSKGTCTAPPLGCAVTQRGTEYCKPGEPRAREFMGGMHRTHLVQFPHSPQSLDFVAGVFALLQALVAHGHLALHAVHAVILQLMVCAGGDLARAQAPAYPALGWGHQTVFG